MWIYAILQTFDLDLGYSGNTSRINLNLKIKHEEGRK